MRLKRSFKSHYLFLRIIAVVSQSSKPLTVAEIADILEIPAVTVAHCIGLHLYFEGKQISEVTTGQTGAPEEEPVEGPVRPRARRRAADVPGGRPRLRRREGPPGGAAGRRCAQTPPELLGEATELGVNMLGVPEELGGVMHEQSAVTSVLIGEALAHGDMGVAYAALAPGAVATAIGLWGSAEQEATYLPPFTGEDVPAAALAILEPRPLFDPLKLETTAKRKGDEWVLSGAKSLIARANECELFVIAAEAEDIGPALFMVESGAKGLTIEDEPAMGLRPAATGRLLIDKVQAARAVPCSVRARRTSRTTPPASIARESPGAASRQARPRPSSTT